MHIWRDAKLRFSKRIKICKGLSINLSKSGASLSAGRKGASINIGSKGTYINAGIPGTGLSIRKKIGGSSGSGSRKRASPNEGTRHVTVELTITLDEIGKPIIKDKDENIITDESILKQLRSQEGYKEAVKKLVLSRKEEIEKTNCGFIEIYKLTPALSENKSAEEDLKQLKFEEYIVEDFSKEEPSIDRIQAQIEDKVRNPVNKLLFWKKDNKTDANELYQRALKNWQEERSVFEDQEGKKKELEDAKRRELYNQRKSELEEEIANSDKAISNKIDKFLNDLMLPVEFSVDYQYYKENKSLYMDLDLPEIEDMPQKKATISSSGKLSIKPKTNKELKEDYARCVIGLAFYFAGNFFNMGRDIRGIVVSGYTQRLSKKSGNVEDEYVYSIKFDRESFKKLNIVSIDPIEAIQNFEHIMNITGSYELKVIKPIVVL